MPDRKLVADFLAHKKISDDLLCEHMLGMIQTMFEGIANKDQTAISKVCEASLAQKLIQASSGVSFTYKPAGDSAIDQVYVVDKLFIKGVNADRSKNDSNADYVALKGKESDGIREYVHKFHLGLQPMYFKKYYEAQLKTLQENSENLDAVFNTAADLRYKVHEQRKQMTDNQFQMILRVTLQLTQGALGKLAGVDGFSSDYTGNHIAVFECKLKVPPQLTLIDHTEREYILAHRLNFANWKLVDLDNFMKGNPYF